jgi:putative phosphoesterase
VLVGVVSDTHNNIKNIKKVIYLFNEEQVDLVIHTGDVSKASTLEIFSNLNSPLVGVFGNNDRIEEGLQEVCDEYNFNFQEPPLSLTLENKKVAVFHEPELIEGYVKDNQDIDLILHGHTHRYKEETVGDIIYFNPGESAGSMKGKSAIGLIDMSNLKIKRIFF